MISLKLPPRLDQAGTWRFIEGRVKGLLAAERDPLASLCNAAAYLYWVLEEVNWVGFYILREGQLVLGPFAGKPACPRIPLDQGVCGAAARTGQIQLVPDVSAFPGHIACDGDSRSELVIPLFLGGKLWGVLDLDSPKLNRFTELDRNCLAAIAEAFGDAMARLPL